MKKKNNDAERRNSKMTIDELVNKLPSNVFFDFLKAHYKDLFDFLGKILKIFNLDADKIFLKED